MDKEAIKQKLSAFRNAIDELEKELDKEEIMGHSSPVPSKRRNLKVFRIKEFEKFYNKKASVVVKKIK